MGGDLRALDAQIESAEREKSTAVENEDYDLAKSLKQRLLELREVRREALAKETAAEPAIKPAVKPAVKPAPKLTKPAAKKPKKRTKSKTDTKSETMLRMDRVLPILVVVIAAAWYATGHGSLPLAEATDTPPSDLDFTFRHADYDCDIDVRDFHNLTEEKFLEEYWLKSKPVLIHAPSINWRARQKWTRKWMLANHGEDPVELGDPYATGVWKMKKQKTSVRTFYNKMDEFDERGQYLWSGTLLKRPPRRPKSKAENKTMESDWRRMKVLHHKELGFEDIQTQVVVGGNGTGLGFHFHKDGFNEVVSGNKRWWFYPKERYVPFYNRFKRHAEWMTQARIHLEKHEQPLHCLQPPGSIMYVPELWNHATINEGETVCVIQNREKARPNGYLHHVQEGSRMLREYSLANREKQAKQAKQAGAVETQPTSEAAAAVETEAAAGVGEEGEDEDEDEDEDEEPPECVLDCQGVPVNDGAKKSDWCTWARTGVDWDASECLEDCDVETVAALAKWAKTCEGEGGGEEDTVVKKGREAKKNARADDGSATHPQRVKDVFAVLQKAMGQEPTHAEAVWSAMMVLQNTVGQTKEFVQLYERSLALHCDHYPKIKDGCRKALAEGQLTLFG
jgi:histone arginine demethylase JMJD6